MQTWLTICDRKQSSAARYEFHVTNVPLRFQTIGERFLGRTLTNVHVVKLD